MIKINKTQLITYICIFSFFAILGLIIEWNYRAYIRTMISFYSKGIIHFYGKEIILFPDPISGIFTGMYGIALFHLIKRKKTAKTGILLFIIHALVLSITFHLLCYFESKLLIITNTQWDGGPRFYNFNEIYYDQFIFIPITVSLVIGLIIQRITKPQSTD